MLARVGVLVVALLTLLLGNSACAQPAPASQPSPFPTSPLRLSELCRRGDERCIERLLLAIPDYQEATQRRRSGMYVTAIGAGVGASLMVGAGLSAAFRSICLISECHRDYVAEWVVGGIGAAVAVASLAVGLPLLISGAHQRRAIRARHLGVPVISMGVRPGQGVLTARWLF